MLLNTEGVRREVGREPDSQGEPVNQLNAQDLEEAFNPSTPYTPGM